MERADLIRLLGMPPVVAEMRDVIVEEREPAVFIESFSDAVAAGGTVFLADPSWGESERAQFNALTSAQPVARSAGASSGLASQVSGLPAATSGWLCIPTGGSSGRLKLARHDEQTISAAVNGFCAHFGVTKVNVVGLLPLYHVSGFMAWMRTVLTGGSYLPCSWKAVESGERPALPADDGDWFLSLVPTQLQRLLGDAEAEDWLRGFRAVFIGGAPAWPELIEAGAKARLPLAFSYGMTETAAMIAALKPEEFLSGARGNGAVMPHARITFDAEGRIGIAGASLFRGYWPELRTGDIWLTEDLGRMDESGSLQVSGRRDALIITGGEKVDPAEVERVLRGTGQFTDVAVIGVSDTQWGEVVVACYPAEFAPHDLEAVARVLASHLAAFKHPKRYVALDRWPRNAQGKVNRATLRVSLEGGVST
ncbi:AMP-binding protein [Rariglobus hedericola]|uniref:AMP-binding protein n=1 Tax=Rariglobus hedericola TaxID=2597822 RepID=A0A556QQQ9_9BACT|nr:AMP-binding protein [Rariglobus hedericola]TSJ78977.1 AMP-binding protein [Rariglobus hedericola]